ncbi:DUF6718 family protein [Ruminococcus sp.]|uniref:DUF6718 family protein n=1 Tax=Ruminococcus sp. TaxID=41978 RepID=UPI00345C080C
MIYLVAKNKNRRGCFAFKTQSGTHIASIKRQLYKEIGSKGIQIVTVSRPTAFGEYAPYNFVQSESEFVNKAKELTK